MIYTCPSGDRGRGKTTADALLDFVFSNGLMRLTIPAPLGLSKVDFAPFLKTGLTHPISPDATLGDDSRAVAWS